MRVNLRPVRGDTLGMNQGEDIAAVITNADANESAAGAIVLDDVACVTCRYNLRTLPADGVCSECGTPVAQSVEAERVRLAELGGLRVRGADYLDHARAGLNRALYAVAFAAIGAMLVAIQVGPLSRDLLLANASAFFWLSPFIASFVLSNLAAWRLTRFDSAVWRGLARACIVVNLAWPGLHFLNVQWARFYFSPNSFVRRGPLWEAFHILPDIAVWLVPASVLALLFTYIRLVELAWRGRRRVVGVLLGLCGLGAMPFCGMFSTVFHITRETIDGWRFAVLLVGPTGSAPLAGMAIGSIRTHIEYRRLYSSLGSDAFLAQMALMSLFIIVPTLNALLLITLRRTIGRAILYGPVRRGD